jgi:hypothetical protein
LKRKHLNKRLKKSLSNLFDKLVEPNENSDDDIVLLQEETNGDEQEVDALNNVLTCLSTYEVIEEKLKLKKKSKSINLAIDKKVDKNEKNEKDDDIDTPEPIYKIPYLKMSKKSKSMSNLKDSTQNDDFDDILCLDDSFEEKKSPILKLRHNQLPVKETMLNPIEIERETRTVKSLYQEKSPVFHQAYHQLPVKATSFNPWGIERKMRVETNVQSSFYSQPFLQLPIKSAEQILASQKHRQHASVKSVPPLRFNQGDIEREVKKVLKLMVETVVTKCQLDDITSIVKTTSEIITNENVSPKKQELQFQMGKRKKLVQRPENSFVDMSSSTTFTNSNTKQLGINGNEAYICHLCLKDFSSQSNFLLFIC